MLHVHFHRDIWNASLAVRRMRDRRLYLSIYMGVPEKNDLLHRYIYRRVDRIFTSSEELNRRLPDLYPIPAEKIEFLPYGRRMEEYTRIAERRGRIRARIGVAPDELLVGTMVRIDPGKGVMDFVRSISYLPSTVRANVRYLIVGEPTRKSRARPGESRFEERSEAYLREIERFIERENVQGKIFLAGFQDDLIGYLDAMDIFVFPSRDELYSLVVLDAMAMGLPVVASRAGGNIAQIQEGRSGLLYTVGDSNDLAGQIARYLTNPALRSDHGRCARAFVEQQHEMGTMISRLTSFYAGERP